MRLLLYNLLIHPLVLLATPFWLLKTHKRGGLSGKLWQKLGIYDTESPQPSPQPIYLHAASVGEANIALKLIRTWQHLHPETHFLLAVGTSTGFDVACRNSPPLTGILYAPLDLPGAVTSMLNRYQPSQIILIEAEVWPNLIHYSSRRNIPLSLANARLSPRSEKRLARFRFLLENYYQKLRWIGAQSESDRPRLESIGIRKDNIHLTGSIKFDPSGNSLAQPDPEVTSLLESLGEGPVLMALSTHAGEELLFAQAAQTIPGARIVIIPRHMERRSTIRQELEHAGFHVLLRTRPEDSPPPPSRQTVLVIDTTGEMPAFTTLADGAFIGKTLLAKGGQNPCEAIAAKVPVLAGPNFQNFEPLASELRKAEAILTVTSRDELSKALSSLTDPKQKAALTERALAVLDQHRGATRKTVAALHRDGNSSRS